MLWPYNDGIIISAKESGGGDYYSDKLILERIINLVQGENWWLIT